MDWIAQCVPETSKNVNDNKTKLPEKKKEENNE